MADGDSSTTAVKSKDESEFVNVMLPREDYRRLSKLLDTLRRVDGWCSINRSIAKIFLYGAIAALIVLSQALDAVRNLFSGLGKH